MNLNPFRRREPQGEERDVFFPNQFLDLFKYGGVTYPVPFGGFQQTLVGNREEISGDFAGLVAGAYKANGIVFACMLTRMLHFAEARFQFRQLRNGRPGNLFGSQDLAILETPWPNGTTGDLLARMIQDVDLAGNSYTLRQGDQLVRLRPDWVYILLGSRSRNPDWVAWEADTEVAAYVYQPGGTGSGADPVLYLPEDVAHFAPIPDPAGFRRGMSWVTPLIREVVSDQAMTSHKLKFLEQGATVNLVVTIPKEMAPTQEKFAEWVKIIREGHEGLANAYRTMFLGAGADVTAVGSTLEQMTFTDVQGAGELRIASAARVPPVMLGLKEGLAGSALNSGNYQQSRRMFADGVMRPMWRQAAAALQTIITVPGGASLWYDDRDIAFLKEDLKDTAEVQQMQAAAIKSLIDAGFEPDAAIDAVTSDDFSRLAGSHTGLTSVQLVPPGSKNGSSANGSQPPVQAQSGAVS